MNVIMFSESTSPTHASVAFAVTDGRTPRQYTACVGQTFIAVRTGHALRSGRPSPGKSFQSLDAIENHYKRDGKTIAGVIRELIERQRDAAPESTWMIYTNPIPHGAQ